MPPRLDRAPDEAADRRLATMREATELLEYLRAAGVELWCDAGRLCYRAPKGVLTRERLDELRTSRAEIVALLAAKRAPRAEPMLERVGVEDDFPLSFIQEWFFDEYARLSVPSLQHLSCAFALHGSLDLPALRRATRELVARQSALRTRFVRVGDEVRASVDQSVEGDVEVLESAGATAADREAAVRVRYTQLVREPFRLEEGRPFRIGVADLGADEHVLFVVLHHIVGDAWSLRVLLKELVVLYDAAACGDDARLPALPLRSCDIARWERRVEAELLEALLKHWEVRFDGLTDDPFFLPADSRPQRDVPAAAQGLFAGTVSQRTLEGLSALARATRSTSFFVVAAVVQVWLKSWSGRDDGLVVVIRDGRDRDTLRDLIGCCVTNWGLRVSLEAGCSFESLVRRIWETYRDDAPFMQLPYYRLEKLLPYHPRSAPEIVLNYWAGDAASSTFARDDVRSRAFRSARLLDWTPTYPWIDDRNMRLYVTFFQKTQSLDWIIRCAGRLFSDSTIAKMSRNLHDLLERVADNPQCTVADLLR